jgi:hypothetical protein
MPTQQEWEWLALGSEYQAAVAITGGKVNGS